MPWPFLIAVMRAFGFGERWNDIIYRLISSCYFSILINGEAKDVFFKSSRGLRQGDPLSPALFIIAAEFLSRSLNNLLQKVNFIPYSVPKGCTLINHLSYADNILIFSSGHKNSLKAIMEVLKAYEGFSGQLINKKKSGFIVGTRWKTEGGNY